MLTVEFLLRPTLLLNRPLGRWLNQLVHCLQKLKKL